jgi:hypothetical protein
MALRGVAFGLNRAPSLAILLCSGRRQRGVIRNKILAARFSWQTYLSYVANTLEEVLA